MRYLPLRSMIGLVAESIEPGMVLVSPNGIRVCVVDVVMGENGYIEVVIENLSGKNIGARRSESAHYLSLAFREERAR